MSGGVRWSEADLRRHEREHGLLGAGGGGARSVAPRSLPKERAYKSKTEASFALYLDLMQKTRQVGAWEYEATRLRLAAGKTYVPDFTVVDVDGCFDHFAEVKGRKGSAFFSRDVGKLKVSVAARLFPYWRFKVYWPGERGEWQEWEVPKK